MLNTISFNGAIIVSQPTKIMAGTIINLGFSVNTSLAVPNGGYFRIDFPEHRLQVLSATDIHLGCSLNGTVAVIDDSNYTVNATDVYNNSRNSLISAFFSLSNNVPANTIVAITISSLYVGYNTYASNSI